MTLNQHSPHKPSILKFVVPVLIVLAGFALLIWITTLIIPNDESGPAEPTSIEQTGEAGGGSETTPGDAEAGAPTFPETAGGLSIDEQYGSAENYAFYSDDEGRMIKILPLTDEQVKTVADDYPGTTEMDGWNCREESGVFLCWTVAEPHSFVLSSQFDQETTLKVANEILDAQ